MSRPRTRPAAVTRDDGSLMLAILFTLVVTALIAAATISAVAGHGKTRHAERFALAQRDADTAVADALRFANQGGDLGVYTGDAAARTPGTATPTGCAGARWCWWAQPDTTGAPGNEYDIFVNATGGGATPRRFVAHLSATLTLKNAASTYGREITYQPAQGPMTNGFAGYSVHLKRDATVDSYDAAVGPATTGVGTVTADWELRLDDAASTNRAVLSNFAASPYLDRCSGPWCQLGTVDTKEIPIIGSGWCSNYTNYPDNCTHVPYYFMEAACKGKAEPPWVASEHAVSGTATLPDGLTPHYDANGQRYFCTTGLYLDTNTVVNGTAANPVRLYLTSAQGGAGNNSGTVTVAPGVQVNMTNPANPTSTRLLVYVKSSRWLNLMSGGTADTNVAWGLWAPNTFCGGSPDPTGARRVHIYGAMTCQSITADGWRLHYDEQMRLLPPTPGASTKVWALTTYRAR